MLPEPLVAGEVGAECEQARDEGAEAEHRREGARGGDRVPEAQHREPGERGEREQPTEVDEALERAGIPRDEVDEGGRVALDLRERPLRGVAEGERPDREASRRRGCGGDDARLRPPARDRVGEHERDRAQRQVHLPGERDRGERGGCEPRRPPLDRVEREREQHRDRARAGVPSTGRRGRERARTRARPRALPRAAARASAATAPRTRRRRRRSRARRDSSRRPSRRAPPVARRRPRRASRRSSRAAPAPAGSCMGRATAPHRAPAGGPGARGCRRSAGGRPA